MATTLPKLRTRYGEGVGVELLVSYPDLAGNPVTVLSDDEAAGQTAISVDGGGMFSIGQYAIMGQLGAFRSELVRVHTSTAPTATVLTLNAATVYPHLRGERVTFIPYNQIVVERSTDGGVSYSVLATIDLRADAAETYYQHAAGVSSDYYRVRFKNSADTAYSGYSDAVIGSGYAANSAGEVIRAAMVSLGETFDQAITREFLWQALYEGRQELETDPRVLRWSFRFVRDADIGPCIPGRDRISLPSRFRDPHVNYSLLGARIGRGRYPLIYADSAQMQAFYQGVARAVLSTAITTGSTSLALDDSGDFDAAGEVMVSGDSQSEEIDAIAYTANDLAGNLTGVTGIATDRDAGAIVWQRAAFGKPSHYTVANGEIVFSQPFSNDVAGQAVRVDYYASLTPVNSDGDVLDEPNAVALYAPYLRFRIKARRNRDLKREEDTDGKLWESAKEAMVSRELSGQRPMARPDIPC